MSIFKGGVIVTRDFIKATPKGLSWENEARFQAIRQVLVQMPPDLVEELFNIVVSDPESALGQEILKNPEDERFQDFLKLQEDSLVKVEASLNIRVKEEPTLKIVKE